jgi:very-short-patch-repair endonuclease
LKEYKKAYDPKYWIKNREKRTKQKKLWYQKNREKILKKERDYYFRNRNKICKTDRREWQEKEIQILEKFIGKIKVEDINKKYLIKRSPCAIMHKARKLGLKSNRSLLIKEKNNPFWNKHHIKETRKKISIAMKGNKIWLGKKHTEEAKELISLAQKKRWQNPEYKDKQVKRLLHTHFPIPTKLEQRFDAFFKQNHLPFRYCGNGSVRIDGKSPDFICNPKKLVIEVGSKNEKNVKKKGRHYFGWRDYERQRKAHFKKWHFDCLCLWEDELRQNPQRILNKIQKALK